MDHEPQNGGNVDGHPSRVQALEELARKADGQMTSDDGVDVTLIRWMLSLTPTERLHVLQQSARSLMRLRDESSLT